MMCQAIYTAVADAMSTCTRDTEPPPGKGGGGRGGMVGRGGHPKQVEVSGNCNCCGKAGYYVREFPKWNMYWDPTPNDTEDNSTKLHCKRGDKLDVTMSYFYVCKRWYYNNAPGHDSCQDTQGGASGTGDHSAAFVAAVGGGEDSVYDFIPFIG